MRFAPESEWGANAGLHVARNLLEPVKRQYPGITYADLWTLAGVVAVEEMGGPKIEWRAGRSDASDGSVCVPDGRLPDAAQGAAHLRDIFSKMGMDDKEIVALSGAHTFGRCHTNRSGFWGPWTRAPTTFSNLYFQELTDNKWTVKKWNGYRGMFIMTYPHISTYIHTYTHARHTPNAHCIIHIDKSTGPSSSRTPQVS